MFKRARLVIKPFSLKSLEQCNATMKEIIMDKIPETKHKCKNGCTNPECVRIIRLTQSYTLWYMRIPYLILKIGLKTVGVFMFNPDYYPDEIKNVQVKNADRCLELNRRKNELVETWSNHVQFGRVRNSKEVFGIQIDSVLLHTEQMYREFDIDVNLYHKRIEAVKKSDYPFIVVTLDLFNYSIIELEMLYNVIVTYRLDNKKYIVDLSGPFHNVETKGDWI